MNAESVEDATSETGVNHIASSDGCILFKARLV